MAPDTQRSAWLSAVKPIGLASTDRQAGALSAAVTDWLAPITGACGPADDTYPKGIHLAGSQSVNRYRPGIGK